MAPGGGFAPARIGHLVLMADHDTTTDIAPSSNDPGVDSQDAAEQLDADGMRLDPNGIEPSGLPGVNAYSDRGPMNSEDPNLLLGGSETRDEIHTREWRERDEVMPDVADERSPVGDLIDPAGATDGIIDSEKRLIGEEATSSHDDTTIPAEVAALTVDPPPER